MSRGLRIIVPIACIAEAMDVKQRERHQKLMKQMRAHIKEIRA